MYAHIFTAVGDGMTPTYLVGGALLVVFTVVDLLWTTLWVEGGAGPLTSPVMALTWRTVRRLGRGNPRALTLAGPLVLVVGFAAWILLFWVGWTLVFAGAGSVLVDTINGGPVSWVELLYFTGYSMFTLGNGDFAPRDGVWQIVTVLVTGSGMLFVTLGVTYVLSVLDAVTRKRSFASGVTGLGASGATVVRTAWNGRDFQGLDLLLSTYTTQLNTLASNHKAYPILHYFHSEQPGQASATGIAVLDDALTILRFGVPAERRRSEAVIANARASVDGYLGTLRGSFIRPAAHAPPPPDLASVRAHGIPTVNGSEFVDAVDELDERRRTLLGLVESDAREWPSGAGE